MKKVAETKRMVVLMKTKEEVHWRKKVVGPRRKKRVVQMKKKRVVARRTSFHSRWWTDLDEQRRMC